MYSPEHWYNSFSTEEYAHILEETYRKNNPGKKDLRISVVPISSADDYRNALISFNQDPYKKGNINYLGHNMWWLSRNLTDAAISTLPKINWNITMNLYSCETVTREDSSYVSWSNQIAQKLSNQLEIPVTWSPNPVVFQIEESMLID